MTYDASNEAKAQPLYLGGFTIDDLIALHLLNCNQCSDATKHSGPKRLGQKSGHCDTYWDYQMQRADYEGKVNNITAHTELGDEAQIINRLD